MAPHDLAAGEVAPAGQLVQLQLVVAAEGEVGGVLGVGVPASPANLPSAAPRHLHIITILISTDNILYILSELVFFWTFLLTFLTISCGSSMSRSARCLLLASSPHLPSRDRQKVVACSSLNWQVSTSLLHPRPLPLISPASPSQSRH